MNPSPTDTPARRSPIEYAIAVILVAGILYYSVRYHLW